MKKIFGSFSFVASLSLATGLFAQQVQYGDVDTIHVVPSRTSTSAVTNTVTVTNYVTVQVPQQPVSWQLANPPSQQPYVAAPSQPVYQSDVVVTPDGRPVERMGDWVPYGGWSYGSNRRSGGGQVTYRSQGVDRRSGPVDVFYSGQSATFSGTVSVPGGYGQSGATVSGRRPVALAPARVHYAAPPRIHYYVAPKVHVLAY